MLPPGRRWEPLAPLLLLLSGMLRPPGLAAFNVDEEKLTVYSGPESSYFGYAVDFHHYTGA